jgi:hypothetical protein
VRPAAPWLPGPLAGLPPAARPCRKAPPAGAPATTSWSCTPSTSKPRHVRQTHIFTPTLSRKQALAHAAHRHPIHAPAPLPWRPPRPSSCRCPSCAPTQATTPTAAPRRRQRRSAPAHPLPGPPPGDLSHPAPNIRKEAAVVPSLGPAADPALKSFVRLMLHAKDPLLVPTTQSEDA